MREVTKAFVGGSTGLALLLGALVGTTSAGAVCGPDAVLAGTTCIDKYEASVWYVPKALSTLIGKIRAGTATLADLTSAKAQAAGVHQVGLTDLGSDWNATPVKCPLHGTGCLDVYAVSIPGITPSSFASWFRAAAAARNAWKRLPTNQEWQVAALGTPEDECNLEVDHPVPTPTDPKCVSDVGAFDMVGNLAEWVAEWVPRADACGSALFNGDGFGGENCFHGADLDSGPAALVRGSNGVFAVNARRSSPGGGERSLGFRGAR